LALIETALKYSINTKTLLVSYLWNLLKRKATYLFILLFSIDKIEQVVGDGEIYINVAAAVAHPSYNSKTEDFDFALLKLETPAVTSSTVGIACLPPDVSQTFVGTSLIISGWGTVSSSGAQSPDLKVATVTGWANADCSKVYSGITGNMICAGTSGFDTDTCQGDSGGMT
jgi:hypothetical protein